MNINTTITVVAQAFAHQLTLLRARCERTSSFDEDKLTLMVTVKREKVEFELFYGMGYSHRDVKAATLGALMDEVWRRAGFDDREAGRIQAAGDALLALPAPPVDEVESAPGDENHYTF